MAIIVLAALIGVAVFVVGLVLRKRKIILIGAPAALLLVAWFFLASSRPNPQREFDRLFGADNRGLASDIHEPPNALVANPAIPLRLQCTPLAGRVSFIRDAAIGFAHRLC